MDIENYNTFMSSCHPCDNQMDELCDSMNDCNVNNNQLTIYIATLLEKFVKEMIYENKYDVEAGQNVLHITPPKWFNSINVKYQDILIKLIEPSLNHFMHNK